MDLINQLKSGTLETGITYKFVLNTQEHTSANGQQINYEPGEPLDAKILRYSPVKKLGTNEPVGVILELEQDYSRSNNILTLGVPMDSIQDVEETDVIPEGKMAILKGGKRTRRRPKTKRRLKTKRRKIRKTIYKRSKSKRNRRKYY